MSFDIYPEQLKTLDSIYADRFLKSTIPVVRKLFGEKVSDKADKDLLIRLREDYHIAHDFKIKSERGITRFICLGYILERDFYERLEFQELFSNNEIDQDKYMDLVFDEAKLMSKKAYGSGDMDAGRENDYYLKDLVHKLAMLIQ